MQDNIMDCEFWLVAEKFLSLAKKIAKQDTVEIYDITWLELILGLGPQYEEQNLLLSKVQNAL